MSKRTEAWVWDNSLSTGNDRIVLVYLADQADDDGANCYPSVERIAEKCRIQKGTVLAVTARLEAAGELLVRRPDCPGRGRFNHYVLVLGRDPAEAASYFPDGCAPPPRKGTESVPFPNAGKVRSGAALGTVRGRFGYGLVAPDPSLRIDPRTDPTDPPVAPTPSFDDFWSVYPRRTDKGGARMAWAKAVKSASPDMIVAGASRFAADPNLPEEQYRPHASTWLNRRRWEDGPLPQRARTRDDRQASTQRDIRALWEEVNGAGT